MRNRGTVTSELFWIEAGETPGLAIMARPRAGDWLEDEIAHWKRSGVEIVVSLLEREEIDDLGLRMEAKLCAASGIEYLSYPIADRGVPNDTDDAMRFAADVVGRAKPTAIHCRAGIGRSSIMAAAVLIQQGISADTALSAIKDARRLPVPDTDAQRDWVMRLANR
jgi:protein-tyrosine phosphatase